MKILIVFAVFLLCALWGTGLFAQAPLYSTGENGTPRLAAAYQSFSDWAALRDLGTEHGWKWYARQLAFEYSRMSAPGEAAHPAHYWEAWQTIHRSKGSGGQVHSAGGWIPVGPTELPPSRTLFGSGLGRINCIAFHPDKPEVFWVGVGQGGLWKTLNGGESWLPLGDDLPLMRISDIAVDPNNPEVLYACLGDIAYVGTLLLRPDDNRPTYFGLGVFRSTDGGLSWQPTGLSFRQTDFEASLLRRVLIDPQDSRRLLAVGFTGAWRSDDAGETWRHTSEHLLWDVEQHSAMPHRIFATSGFIPFYDIGSSHILRSDDFGDSWEILAVDIPPTYAVLRMELAIAPGNPDVVYCVASNLYLGFYGLYRSTNGGASWTRQSSAGEGSPNILGYRNGTSAGGQATYDLTICVHPENTERVFVGGINLWGSTDGGRSWDGVSDDLNMGNQGVHADQHFLAWNPNDRYFYLCNDGGLYRSASIEIGSWLEATSTAGYEWPTEWEYMSNGMAISSFYRIGISQGNELKILGGTQDNSTAIYTNGAWTTIFAGDGMECFFDDSRPGVIYGSSQFGSLYYSEDEGRSFGSIELGITERGAWITPFAKHPSEAGTVLAAFENVWRFTSDGIGTRLSNFPRRSSSSIGLASAFAIAEADPAYMYVARQPYFSTPISPAEMWLSDDAGDSWRRISTGLADSVYITYIAVHERDPQTAWITLGSFYDGVKVFKTTNAGNEWRNISANLPNLPVNCVVHDGQSPYNTVYVGTDIGVYYTNDVLDEWLPYNELLPNVIVNELEIHTASRRLYAATFGRGIWMSDLVDVISSSGAEPVALQVRPAIQPNPNNGRFTLAVTHLPWNTAIDISIVDVLGRQVYMASFHAEQTSFVHAFDLDVPLGVYYLRMQYGSRSAVARFIVE